MNADMRISDASPEANRRGHASLFRDASVDVRKSAFIPSWSADVRMSAFILSLLEKRRFSEMRLRMCACPLSFLGLDTYELTDSDL